MKIKVFGASGTGKSTLASALSKRLGVAHFDADNYYHFPTDPPFQRQRTPEDRAQLLTKDPTAESSWVLSGGAALWTPAPQLNYSIFIFIELPQSVRLERLRDREAKLYGDRIKPSGDMHQDHLEFMRWTAGYEDGTAEGTNTLPNHLGFLSLSPIPHLKIDGLKSTNEQIDLVLAELKRLGIG